MWVIPCFVVLDRRVQWKKRGDPGPVRGTRIHRCWAGQANSLLMSQHSSFFFCFVSLDYFKRMPLSEFCCCHVVSILPVADLSLYSLINKDFLYIVTNQFSCYSKIYFSQNFALIIFLICSIFKIISLDTNFDL